MNCGKQFPFQAIGRCKVIVFQFILIKDMFLNLIRPKYHMITIQLALIDTNLNCRNIGEINKYDFQTKTEAVFKARKGLRACSTHSPQSIPEAFWMTSPACS